MKMTCRVPLRVEENGENYDPQETNDLHFVFGSTAQGLHQIITKIVLTKTKVTG